MASVSASAVVTGGRQVCPRQTIAHAGAPSGDEAQSAAWAGTGMEAAKRTSASA